MPQFTNKEKQIIILLAEGYNSKEIAKKLENSKTTIDTIRMNMLRKFRAKNVAHLVAKSFREKKIF